MNAFFLLLLLFAVWVFINGINGNLPSLFQGKLKIN